MPRKSSKLNWETIFEPGKVHDDLKKTIIGYQKFEIFIKILPDIFHKLKNKLTPIMGYTQLLSLKIKDNDIRKKLERIEKNSEELSQLLDQLREYFKDGKGVKTRINLNDIIIYLDSFFSEITKNHKIKVDIDLDENIPDHDFIYGQIEILVKNIIENAVQAIENNDMKPESGCIQVKTSLAGEEVKLSITDNGMGMKPETLSKIWLPFYSEFPKGTGIGLLVCETIISNHGGRFHINSREGAGTEFEIYFKINQ